MPKRNNFQSLLLVIFILLSLWITKESGIKTAAVKKPASFLESVNATTLTPPDSAEGEIVSEIISILPQIKIIPFEQINGFSSASETAVSNSFSAPLSPEKIQPLTYRLNAQAVLVSDFDNGAELISYRGNRRWPLASIAKLMTAILAIEEIGAEKEISVSAQAVATEGAAGKLQAGQFYKIEDLIKLMIITSSNDAAAALAEFYTFGRENFIKLMNKKAADLEMNATVFFDPAGLSPVNQSTPEDIRKLIGYIAKNHPGILQYSKEANFNGFRNIHPFAGQDNFLGGKTGYLEEAKQNLVALFLVNERRILIIVLGAEDRFRQTQELLHCVSIL